MDGIYPNPIPIAADTPKAISIAFILGAASKPKALPSRTVKTYPNTIPREPPMQLMRVASITNCLIISFFRAPIAFRIPISLVLSTTDTNMMFIIPIPATNRDIPAIPPKIEDSIDVISVIISSSIVILLMKYRSSFFIIPYRYVSNISSPASTNSAL